MAQCAQLQPQVHLPFFLSFLNLTMTAMTIAASSAQTMIVPMLAASHANMAGTPFLDDERCAYLDTLMFPVSLVASLYGRKSSQPIPASNAAETIRPMTLRWPVKAPPIWLTSSAMA